jgi:hypothetical protein
MIASLFRYHNETRAKPLSPVSDAAVCAGWLDVIRRDARPIYKASSIAHLCWEFQEPKGPEAYHVNLLDGSADSK